MKLTATSLGDKDTATLVLRFLSEAAYLWSYRGQYDKAISIFKALTMLAPDAPVGHQGLAEVYITQQKFKEAEKEADLASKAKQSDRRTTAFAYKLRGRAQIQMNKLKDAEKSLLRAAEIDNGGEEGKAAEAFLETARQLGIFTPAAGRP